MKQYEPPKCDCGEILYYTVEYSYEVRRRINKNGSLAKRPFFKSRGIANEEGFEALVCPKCNTTYEVNGSLKGIYRGKKMY